MRFLSQLSDIKQAFLVLIIFSIVIFVSSVFVYSSLRKGARPSLLAIPYAALFIPLSIYVIYQYGMDKEDLFGLLFGLLSVPFIYICSLFRLKDIKEGIKKEDEKLREWSDEAKKNRQIRLYFVIALIPIFFFIMFLVVP